MFTFRIHRNTAITEVRLTTERVFYLLFQHEGTSSQKSVLLYDLCSKVCDPYETAAVLLHLVLMMLTCLMAVQYETQVVLGASQI